jgi:DNA-binding winged helix-turn-helix (wHTH) protein/tetratricopeptide (TPR) repeat protein
MESALGFAPRRGFAVADDTLAASALWPRARAPTTLARVTRRLRFGPHLIDLAARELSDDGRLLQLSPRIFDCIAYLIEHRDRAVGRDELMAAVWGRADIADTQLAQVILKARRAVGDSGEAQHAIRTVAGFGYRWVSEVAEETGAPETPLLEMTPSDEPARAGSDVPQRVASHWRSSPLFVALAGAAILGTAIATVLVWRWQHTDPRATVPTGASASATATAAVDRTVAVLPAEIDASEEWAWLRLGVMEFVAGRLRSAGQTVAPSENVVSVMRSAGTSASLPDAVRSALDPHWIVLPHVRRADAGWTVSLELRARGADTREFPARADDAIAAARAASDRLLVALGQPVPDEDAANRPAEELLSRIDAALLVDDLDVARRLLLGSSAALRATPALRLRQAEIDFVAGHDADAADQLSRLRADVRAETAPLLRARIVSTLAATQIRLGRAADSESHADEALALLEGRGEPALLGKTFMRRGVARSLLGRHDDALADFAQARIAMQLAGDTLGLAQVELNEGALNGVRNHPADALASFARAEKIFARIGVSGELANALANQVVAHRVLLQPDAALAASARGLALLGRLANADAANLIRVRRAQALADVGRWSEAVAQLEELARAIDSTRAPELAGMVANERARIDLLRGRADAALALVDPVLSGLPETEFASTRSEAWFIAVRALRVLGRDTEAAASTQHYSAWAEQSGNSTFVVHARLLTAEQAVAEHRDADADRLYQQALSEANRQNVPADIADVAISFANALIRRNELARAVPIAGQLDRFAAHDFASAVLQARLYRALGQTEAWRSALDRARSLAGERPLPDDVVVAP